MLDIFVRRFSEEQASGFQPSRHDPENQWLEDVSPTFFWGGVFYLYGGGGSKDLFDA